MNKYTMIAIGLGSAVPLANGQVFLNSLGTTLYRTTMSGGTMTESFTLSADLTSMAVNPVTGEIFGAARTDSDGDGFFELYRLDNPEGTPSLTFIGDFLEENTTTLSFVDGGRLLGMQAVPGGSDNSVLVEVDLNMLTQSTIDGDVGDRLDASGYDPSSGTLFANSNGNSSVASLFTVPFNDVDVVANPVGLTGQQAINHGGEFFNGTYYQAVNVTGGNLLIGSINTTTGAFTPLIDLGTSSVAPIGLAVIPSPGAAGLFGLAGVAGLRRRR